jgi:predicted acylesterase/phospholipase RssA
MDIQLSIQGGAARLPALMAAAAAFQDCETEGKLNIRRYAGTSAGAIVAALSVAGKQPLPDICAAISKEFQSKIPQWFAPQGTLGSMYRIWRGDVIYEQAHLREILAKFIDPSLRFNALPRPLYIVASDLESRTSKTFGPEETPEETVLRAVLASSALPFIFVSHKSFGSEMNPVLVDGGICDNLPVEPLVANDGEAHFGKVFAISFKPAAAERPASPFDLARRVVDTSINHAVARSKALIGEAYICPTKTSSDGKDFHRVAERISPEAGEYRAIRAETYGWLFAGHIATAQSSPDSSATVSTASAPSPDAVMSQAYRAFDVLKRRFPYTTASVTVTMTVDSLWPSDDPRHSQYDEIAHVTRIESSSPLVVYGCTLGEIDDRSTNVMDVQAQTPAGQIVGVEHVRALRPSPNGKPTPYLVVFFTAADGATKLAIKKTTYLKDSMNLLRGGKTSDYFVLQLKGDAPERVSEVTMIVKTPATAGGFVLEKPTAAEAKEHDLGEAIADGRMLGSHELKPDVADGSAVYTTLAWRAENVEHFGGVVAAAIRKRTYVK